MMSWDERYSDAAYVYGTQPNDFLAEHVGLLQGPVLSLAEGEGRNAVFMATRGLSVLGVDASAVGLDKAQALAREQGVAIRTEVADLSAYEAPDGTFGAVVSIFAHLPRQVREPLYQRLLRALQPGGIFLLEAYSRDQLRYGTGGPKDADLLMHPAELKEAFGDCEILLAHQVEREVLEGRLHTGLASVVQLIARKPLS